MSAMGRFDANATVTMGMVSGPISQALVVTAAGIVVAVESVILYNYFNQRAGRIASELKLLTDEYLEQLDEAPIGTGVVESSMATGESAASVRAASKA